MKYMSEINEESEVRLVYQMHTIMLCIPARDELMFGFELSHNQYTKGNGTKCII